MALKTLNITINGGIHIHNGETTEYGSHKTIQETSKTIINTLNNLLNSHAHQSVNQPVNQSVPITVPTHDVNQTIINAVKHYEGLGQKANLQNIYRYCLNHIPLFCASIANCTADIRTRIQWITIDNSWFGNGKMAKTPFEYIYNGRRKPQLWRIKKGVYKIITPEQKQNLRLSYHSDYNYEYILLIYYDIKIEFKKNKSYITKRVLP